MSQKRGTEGVQGVGSNALKCADKSTPAAHQRKGPRSSWEFREGSGSDLAALSRVAINLIKFLTALIKKPNKPKKPKDLKLQ